MDVDRASPELGFAWTVPVSAGLGPGDTREAPRASRLRLFENERALAPAHALHAVIREYGGGAYSHWHDTLYFSTSDGSDPRSNGRIYHLGVAEHDAGPYPLIVGLETINTCNARCPFCPLFQGEATMARETRPAKIMDSALFERCVSQIAGWPVRPSTLFLNMNGEPLQDPRFAERLDFVARQGLGAIVNLQTNGQFLTPRLAEAILSAGVLRITIGFDAATKAVYEQHRVRCDYDRVLGHIRGFVELRRQTGRRTGISVQYVRTRRNDHEVLPAYEMFSKFLDPELDSFNDTLAKDWGDDSGAEDFFYIPKLETAPEPRGCPTFDAQLIVHSDGTVAACCWDYNLSVSTGGFGNARETPLLDIWRGAARRKLGAALSGGDASVIPEKCRTCSNLSAAEPLDPGLAKITDSRMSAAYGAFNYRFAKPAAPAEAAGD